MNSRDLFALSFKNLLRRKTRTILAIIGVVVGICAIIVMLSIGFGLSEGFKEQIESYGNLHLVEVFQGGGFVSYGMGGEVSSSSAQKEAKLDDSAITSFEKIKGVGAATPKVYLELVLIIGKFQTSSTVMGVRPEVLEKFNYDVEDGRFLQPNDKEAILFGNDIPNWFYNPKSPYGNMSGAPLVNVISDKIILTADYSYGHDDTMPGEEKVNYPEYKFRGVGILANPNDYDTAYNCYIPIETAKKIQEETAKAEKRKLDKNAGYDQAMVYVEDINDVQRVSDTIREMGYQTSSLNDFLEAMQEQARMIQGILGGIGAISLFVAALGITNTMIMSIYERTKEIGVMKVIGADLADIRKLFLIEAALIGFLGGLVGIGLSYLLSLVFNSVLAPILSAMMGGMVGSRVSIIPWWLPLGALAFSTIIGVLSGYSPARRAMNLSALESLRNE